MNKKNLKIIYDIWGGDVWPVNPVMSTLKHIGDKLTLDTSLKKWDTVVYGGDAITRIFTLRALSKLKPSGHVLYIPPNYPNECLIPWMFSLEAQENLNQKYFGGRDDLIKNLNRVADESVLRLKTFSGSFKRTTRMMVLSPGDPHIMVLKKLDCSFDEDLKRWSRLDPKLFNWMKNVSIINEKPALIGGEVKEFWCLSGNFIEKRDKIKNFSLAVSINQPILKAESKWHQNLKELWSLNERKTKI